MHPYLFQLHFQVLLYLINYINSKEITVWYQEENRHSIVRSLKDNIEYLDNLIKGSQTR